jgi:hypothetical protein
MADWKQITARIRRARTGKDPAGQLTNLFSKTRDAMVAFELARYFETTGNTADAGRWYLTAAERFRRADWKTKAQESATRLGATEPAEIALPQPRAKSEPAAEEIQATSPSTEQEPNAETIGETNHEPAEIPVRAKQNIAPLAKDSSRHRRGRRGGRDSRPQRREQQVKQSAAPAAPESPPVPIAEENQSALKTPEVHSAPSLRGRYGDPGLSSRLSQLEMNFRRLLGSTPMHLDAADKAPAGPGVWVLTDSDLTTYYYVEPCQTLRVAIPHLLRGGSSRKGDSIRPRLAEYLGIPETKVSKYLGDHCVVRWLQMDDDVSHFAHFLIAVLRPALNE